MSKQFDKVLDTVQEGLPRIQKSFGEYQDELFQERPAEFFCLELCGEAGELANFEKKIWKGKNIEKQKLEDETADIFIALINYANARGINLSKALNSKLKRIEEKRKKAESQGESY